MRNEKGMTVFELVVLISLFVIALTAKCSTESGRVVWKGPLYFGK